MSRPWEIDVEIRDGQGRATPLADFRCDEVVLNPQFAIFYPNPRPEALPTKGKPSKIKISVSATGWEEDEKPVEGSEFSCPRRGYIKVVSSKRTDRVVLRGRIAL